MAALIASLTGCATPPASAPQDNFWSGRLALRIDTEPPQSLSAAFELRGHADEGELALMTPLGQTVALARWSAAGATLQQGEQQMPYASMDELTQQLTGATLPLAALFQWLRGQPVTAPGWSVDLGEPGAGRILAQRQSPLPRAELRLRLQP